MIEIEDKPIPIYKPGDILKEIEEDPNNKMTGRVFFIGEPKIIDGMVYYDCWVHFPFYSTEDKWAFMHSSTTPEWFLMNYSKRIDDQGAVTVFVSKEGKHDILKHKSVYE